MTSFTGQKIRVRRLKQSSRVLRKEEKDFGFKARQRGFAPGG